MAETVQFQCLLGLQCKDFAMIAADQTTTQSIIILKNDENKIHKVADKLIMGMVGDPGAAEQFAQFVSKNLLLYQMRNKYQLDAAAAVHFTRKNMVDMLKSGNATMVNMLVAGYDENCGGQLFSLDFLASCIQVPYAVHGFGGYLSIGILDRYHSYSLSPVEAHEILKMCVHEIHQRLFTSLANFQVQMVSKDGIRHMPTINNFSYNTK